MGGDQTEVDIDAEAAEDAKVGADEHGPFARWSRANWAVIGVLTALTLVGIGLAAGTVEGVVSTDSSGSNAVTVPLYVYLYSGFGALGYALTKLVVQLDQYTKWGKLTDLVSMALRIPAAWVLATGIYLFLGDLGSVSGTTGAQFTAGVAFLVGLYVNVSLKALGSLADRILGRSQRQPE